LTFLFRIGADPNLHDKSGQTLLYYAAAHGTEEAIDSLLATGADHCAADNDGLTVLHSAAKGSSLNVLVRLFDLGAYIHASTVEKRSYCTWPPKKPRSHA